jgi:glycosyltransferase involved in cell wall biosynthesis
MFGVSAVVPAYNEAPRIGRAIQSVLAQTQPVNEVIVVDDGSTDRTADVVASFGDAITLVRQTNQGLAVARNTGIRRARNEWIAFLDADDEWLPDHIRNAGGRIRDHPEIGWYCAAFERRSDDGTLIFQSQVDNSLLLDGVIENYFLAEADSNFSRPSSMLVRKSVFDEVGLFNVEINQYGEDLDMWFRIALRYPAIGYSKSAGCIYWQREGSITSGSTPDLPRFLRRIGITRSSTGASTGVSSKEGEGLIRVWVLSALKCAIKQRDRQNLATCARKYHELLPRRWKALAWLLQNNAAMELAHIGLSLRGHWKHE